MPLIGTSLVGLNLKYLLGRPREEEEGTVQRLYAKKIFLALCQLYSGKQLILGLGLESDFTLVLQTVEKHYIDKFSN